LIRHYLHENLLIGGGHIGYFVRSDKCGNGYGKEVLRLALQELNKLGEPRALVTVHVDNIVSIRFIEANGAGGRSYRVRWCTGTVLIKGIVFDGNKVWLRKNERDEWELSGGKLEINKQLDDAVTGNRRKNESNTRMLNILEVIFHSKDLIR
jgi:hypothetical protein